MHKQIVLKLKAYQIPFMLKKIQKPPLLKIRYAPIPILDLEFALVRGGQNWNLKELLGIEIELLRIKMN